MKRYLLLAFLVISGFACEREIEQPGITGEWQFDYLLQVYGPYGIQWQETRLRIIDSIPGTGTINFLEEGTGVFGSDYLTEKLGGNRFIWQFWPDDNRNFNLTTTKLSTWGNITLTNSNRATLIMPYFSHGGVGSGSQSFLIRLVRSSQ
jgi:hypothetical protein